MPAAVAVASTLTFTAHYVAHEAGLFQEGRKDWRSPTAGRRHRNASAATRFRRCPTEPWRCGAQPESWSRRELARLGPCGGRCDLRATAAGSPAS